MKNLELITIKNLLPQNSISFATGSATIMNPGFLPYMNELKKRDEEFYTITTNNFNIYAVGDFNNFKMYMIATHPRFEIIENSVHIINNNKFTAKFKFFYPKDYAEEHEIVFKIPVIFPTNELSIEIGKYSECWNDGFIFKNDKIETRFVCDLSFIAEYAEDLSFKIPLNIEYIGIAKADGRDIYNRLGSGHQKLQEVLADLNNKPNKKCSIILYKFDNYGLKAKVDNLSTTLELIEATMIKYFQPMKNIERKKFPRDSKKLVNKVIKQYGHIKIFTLIESPRNCSMVSNLDVGMQIQDKNLELLLHNCFKKIYSIEHINFNAEHIIQVQI